MQKWEYKTIMTSMMKCQERANEVGNEGWELVSTATNDRGDMFLVFKRPLGDQ